MNELNTKVPFETWVLRNLINNPAFDDNKILKRDVERIMRLLRKKLDNEVLKPSDSHQMVNKTIRKTNTGGRNSSLKSDVYSPEAVNLFKKATRKAKDTGKNIAQFVSTYEKVKKEEDSTFTGGRFFANPDAPRRAPQYRELMRMVAKDDEILRAKEKAAREYEDMPLERKVAMRILNFIEKNSEKNKVK